MNDKNPPAVDRAVALDIEELDHGLLQLLLPQIQSMFQHMRLSSAESTDKLIHSTAIYILKAMMIYLTQLSSPAMRHLNVRVCENGSCAPRNNHNNNDNGSYHNTKQSPSPRSVRNVIGITCLLPFLQELLMYRYRILQDKLRRGDDDDHDDNDDDNGDISEEEQLRLKRGQRRQVMILHIVLRTASIFIPSIQLYHYLSFILNPKNRRIRTPSFALNANQLSYEYKDTKDGFVERKVNLLYGYRRVWYEELMLLMSILPVDVWKRFPKTMKRWYRHMLVQIKAMMPNKLLLALVGNKGLNDCSNEEVVTRDNYAQHSCSICKLRPVVIPYKTNCGHLCCYTCLRVEMLNSNFHYKCLVCGERVESGQSLLEG